MVKLLYEPPCGIEAAAHKLANATERDGFKSASVDVYNGHVTNMWLCERDGTKHFVQLIGSEWFEYFDVPGGENDGC